MEYWYQFMDMHSGGDSKLDWEYIYLRAGSDEEAVEKFETLFGRDPHNITCECCGADYSISYELTLEQATAFHRGEGWKSNIMPLEQYVTLDTVKIVE